MRQFLFLIHDEEKAPENDTVQQRMKKYELIAIAVVTLLLIAALAVGVILILYTKKKGCQGSNCNPKPSAPKNLRKEYVK